MSSATAGGETRGYVEGPDGLVHYRRQGEGPPLLLLHQTPSSSEQFTPSMPLFARSRDVIAVDTPGFGLSDAPAEPPSARRYAESYVAVLDALGIEKVDLLGHHTGATFALETAAAFPERINRLVLFGVLAVRSEEERAWWRKTLLVEYELDGRMKFLDTFVLKKVGDINPDADGPQAQRELIAALQAGPDYWWAYRAVVEHRSLERLQELRCDLLLLDTSEDDPALAETMKAAAPTVAHTWVGLTGLPSLHFREPQAYVDAVLTFLDAPRAADTVRGV